MKIPLLPKTLGGVVDEVIDAATLKLAVARLLLIVSALVLLAFMIAFPPSALVMALIAFIVTRIWGDDFVSILMDLWNLRFWGIEVGD